MPKITITRATIDEIVEALEAKGYSDRNTAIEIIDTDQDLIFRDCNGGLITAIKKPVDSNPLRKQNNAIH